MTEEGRNTDVLRLECYRVLSNRESLYMKSLDTSMPCPQQTVFPGAVITAFYSSPLTHIEQFPWLVAPRLKIDTRKVFSGLRSGPLLTSSPAG